MSSSGRVPTAGNNDMQPPGGISRALELMEAALAILDEAQAPADIGAYLDLAIHRLKVELAKKGQTMEMPFGKDRK